MKSEELFRDPEYMERTTFFESGITWIDKIVFLTMTFLIVSTLIIALWSSILLATDRERGGGPLGMIARGLHIQLLLSAPQNQLPRIRSTD